MGDLESKKLIYLKAVLFLLSGFIAIGLVLLEIPTLKVLMLMCIAIWCFCRSYYFAFYVIENYVDSKFKYSGLVDFAKYLAGYKH